MIYLIRHGETEWNREGRLQGSKDSPLTFSGIRQAIETGKFLAGYLTKPSTLYSSPQKRALYSAYIIGTFLKQTPFEEVGLYEKDNGIWEGHLVKDLDTLFDRTEYHKNKIDYCPPLGESYRTMMKRIQNFWEYLSTREDDSILVSHQTVCRYLISGVLDIDPEFCPKMMNSEIYSLDPIRREWKKVKST